MLRNLPFLLLRATLLPLLIRELVQRRRVTILLYHAVAPDVLDRHLHALKRVYTFVAMKDYLEAREGGRPLPPKALVLTLDDGHASNRALLPVLEKHGVRATVFLCTRIVGTRRRFWFEHPPAKRETATLKTLPDMERLERMRALGFDEDREYEDRQALTWEEVAEMRAWVDFQPHSRFHPILPRCSDERAREEIVRSKKDLEDRGYPADVFAYPNGDYTAREARLAREAGYRCALTIDPGFNAAATDPFLLKRIGVPDGGGTSELLVRASGIWSRLRVLFKGRYQTQEPY